MSNVIYFRRNFVHRKFKLGEIYLVKGNFVKFIKVTPKGFNFLNCTTHKCILKKHVYARKYAGLDIPNNIQEFKVAIPVWLDNCIILVNIEKTS